MKRVQQALLLCCILGAAYIAGGLIADALYVPPVKRVRKLSSIVRLVDDKGATFCTGTVIGLHTVLTAAHCVLEDLGFGLVSQRKDIGIRPPNNLNVSVTANVIQVRYQMDQAVLTGDFKQFQVAPFISDVKTLDTTVKEQQKTACGFPLGGPLYCTTIFFKEPIQFFWKIKGTLIPGMSGGPVLLNDGTVVATNVAVEGDSSIVSPTYNLLKEAGE